MLILLFAVGVCSAWIYDNFGWNGWGLFMTFIMVAAIGAELI
jgi:hypothetical protein